MRETLKRSRWEEDVFPFNPPPLPQVPPTGDPGYVPPELPLGAATWVTLSPGGENQLVSLLRACKLPQHCRYFGDLVNQNIPSKSETEIIVSV